MGNATVRYQLAQEVDGPLIKVTVERHENMPWDNWVTFERVRPTMDNPEEECFSFIYDPSELIAIAKMALTAWEQLVQVNAETAQIRPTR